MLPRPSLPISELPLHFCAVLSGHQVAARNDEDQRPITNSEGVVFRVGSNDGWILRMLMLFADPAAANVALEGN